LDLVFVYVFLRAHRLPIAIVVIGLLSSACVGIAVWAIRAQWQADRATEELKDQRAELARERELTRIARLNEQEQRTRARLTDSRRLAALSESERDKHPDRALLLAVEAIHRENTLEARVSLLDALLHRPAVTSFYHRANGRVLSVAYSPDGKTLAAGCADSQQGGMVLLCDPSRSTDTALPVPEGAVSFATFSRQGKILAAGIARRGGGAGVVLWDPARRARLVDQPLNVPGHWISSMAFSRDEKTLAVGCSTGQVMVCEVSNRPRLVEEPLLVNEQYEVKSLAFSADGNALITVCGGRLELWEVATRKRISVLSTDTESIECAALGQDGRSLAAGVEAVDDNCAGVVFWDMVGRRRLSEPPLAVSAIRVTHVAFGSDSLSLAAGFDDTVVLWDLTRCPPLAMRPLNVADSDITSLAFSPDGKSLAAGYRRRVGGGR
jgi:hypothetical protein